MAAGRLGGFETRALRRWLRTLSCCSCRPCYARPEMRRTPANAARWGNIGMPRLARHCAVPCAARRARRGVRPRRAAATCGPDRRRQRVAGPARRGRWRGDKAGKGPSVPVSVGWYVLQHAACLSHRLRQALPLPRPIRWKVSGPAAWRRSVPGPRAGTRRWWIRRDRWTPRPAARACRVVAACHPRPPQRRRRCPGHGRCPAPR